MPLEYPSSGLIYVSHAAVSAGPPLCMLGMTIAFVDLYTSGAVRVLFQLALIKHQVIVLCRLEA